MTAWADAVAAADATVELDSVELDETELLLPLLLLLDDVRLPATSPGMVPLLSAARPDTSADADDDDDDDELLDAALDELLLGAAEGDALLEGEGELLLDAADDELDTELELELDGAGGGGDGDSDELDGSGGGGDHVLVLGLGGGVQVLVDGSGGGVQVLVSGSGVHVDVGLGSSLVVGLGSSPPPPPPPKLHEIWNTPCECGAPSASNSVGDRSRSPYEHVGHESTIDALCVIPVSVFVIVTCRKQSGPG